MKVAIAAILLAVAAPALADAIIDPASIDQAVATFTGSPIGAPGGAIAPADRRLRLAACADVAMSWRTPRHDMLLLECRSGAGWKLFVPIAANGVRSAGSSGEVQGVDRGDVVTIQVKGQGYSVSQSGEAMEAGAVGSWIKIKLPGKADALSAQVVRPGLVDLPPS